MRDEDGPHKCFRADLPHLVQWIGADTRWNTWENQGGHKRGHSPHRYRSFLMVGAPRFELGTPCTPCKCATRLRHAPTIGFFSAA